MLPFCLPAVLSSCRSACCLVVFGQFIAVSSPPPPPTYRECTAVATTAEIRRRRDYSRNFKEKKRTCSKMLRGDLQNMTDEDWEELVHDAHRVDWGMQEKIINMMREIVFD
eukprot:scaffold7674_cov150-Skeletonema_marinoi.AAC.4